MAKLVTFQIYGTTKTNLDSMTLLEREMCFTIDTLEVYIGDSSGNKILIGRAIVDTYANMPTAGVSGRIFVASDTKDVYVDDGNAWIKTTVHHLSELAGTLDDISDGSTYGRVRKTELTNGLVSRVNDGSHSANAQELRQHLDNDSIHVPIDDTAHGPDNVISAAEVDERIQSAVSDAVFSNDRREPVLSRTTDEPTSPSEGDRYIVPVGSTGTNWSGHDNDIAEYKNGAWVFNTPEAGWLTFVLDEDTDGLDFQFNKSGQWVPAPTSVNHNSTLNKQGGRSNEYYHHTYAEWVRNRTAATDSVDGYMTKEDHQKLPTTNEKEALAGTDGIPSDTNRYVTDSDSRLTDARTPTTHTDTHKMGGSDEVGTQTPTPNAIPYADANGRLNAWIDHIDCGVF